MFTPSPKRCYCKITSHYDGPDTTPLNFPVTSKTTKTTTIATIIEKIEPELTLTTKDTITTKMSAPMLDPVAEFTTIIETLPQKDEFNLPLNASLPGMKSEPAACPPSTSSEYTVPSSVLELVFSTTLDEFGLMQDHTPMFDDLDLALDGAKVNDQEWVSLFSDQQQQQQQQQPITEEDVDLLEKEIDFAIRENEIKLTHAAVVAQQPSKRSYSSAFELTPQPTPLLDCPKKARTTKKARQASLPPIDVDVSDPAALKRAKNTEAARRSRARKLEKMNILENKVDALTKEKNVLENEVHRLQELLKQNGIGF